MDRIIDLLVIMCDILLVVLVIHSKLTKVTVDYWRILIHSRSTCRSQHFVGDCFTQIYK